jgi:hypothetical protein
VSSIEARQPVQVQYSRDLARFEEQLPPTGARGCRAQMFVRCKLVQLFTVLCPASKRGSLVRLLVEAVPQFSRDHVTTACAVSKEDKTETKVRCWMKELYRQRMQYGNR